MRGAPTARGMLLLAAACATVLLSATAPAFGQGAVEMPDSLKQYRWSPQFMNKIDANVSSVGMLNKLTAALNTPWGSNFNFELSSEEKNYRLQNRLEQNKLMRLTDVHIFNPFWMGSATASESRVFNRSIAVGGGVQDLIFNDQQANLNSVYRRTLHDVMIGDVRFDAQGTGGVINSERAFKTDKGIQGGANGGFAYDIGDLFTVQARGAVRNTWDQSTVADTTLTGLGSSEDSLATVFTFVSTDSIRFDASHKRYSGDRDFTNQAVGSLGSQLEGEENVYKETEMRDTRNTTLMLSSHLGRRFTLSLTASHDDQVFDYAVDSTRFSRTVADEVSGNITYRLPWKTTTSLQFENGETLNDLGPTSNSSLTDKKKRVALNASHKFSSTFSMDFTGSSAITQTFYLDPEANPRDRDQVDTNLNVRMTSRPFRDKLMANITLSYGVTEVINIDETQSRDNRTRERWDLRPTFTYYFRPYLTIVQVYGLAFDYTDYDYQSTLNFLDRNIVFSNEFKFLPTKKIATSFLYALTLHDKGSYLPDPITGEEVLDVTSEDRRDRTLIRVDYTATDNIKFFGENEYTRFQTGIPGPDNDEVTTEGQIVVGATADYNWGTGKTMRLLMSRVKRFSALSAEAAKNYWDARSEIIYTF